MTRKLSRLLSAGSAYPMNNSAEKGIDEIFMQLMMQNPDLETEASVPMNDNALWDGSDYPNPTDGINPMNDNGTGMTADTEDGIPSVKFPENTVLDLLIDSLSEDLMNWTAEDEEGCSECTADGSEIRPNELDVEDLFPGYGNPMEVNYDTPSYPVKQTPMSM